MIADFVLGHRWLMPVVLLVLVVAGPPIGARLAGRPRFTLLLLALSVAPIVVLTLVPVDTVAFARCEVAWSLPTPAKAELFANMVLFVPPTLLAAIATRRPLLVLGAACVLSAAIEATQALVPALGRACDTTDLLCNALGAVIGAALGLVALRLAGRLQAGAPTVSPRG